MKTQYRLALFGMVLLAFTMVGCSSRAFGGFTLSVEAIEEAELVRTIQYLDETRTGPAYEVRFTVPESWIGNFETSNYGNRIVFEYVVQPVNDRGFVRRAPIFYVDALSNAQYWEQIGSYPGMYKTIINTADTYMIYHLPIDAYYSGLPRVQFDAFAAEVPVVIASITTNRVG